MSSKSAKKPAGEPYERIIDTAKDLFFKQGYRATGINQIIDESGVAKATFYSHFKSKDELCCEYLKALSSGEMINIAEHVAAANNTRERYMAPMASTIPWLKATNFRGCPFVNIASEVPDASSPLRKVGMDVYGNVGKTILELCQELVASDKKYAHLDPDKLATDYLLIMAGAISLAELYHAIWPAKQGMESVARLID